MRKLKGKRTLETQILGGMPKLKYKITNSKSKQNKMPHQSNKKGQSK